MPTYEYVCTECGTPLEVVQSIHEPSLTQCPACQGRLRKVFGNVGVVFKGSGFYRTDSRGKKSAGAGGKAPDRSDQPAAASDAKPTAAKSADAKPAESAPAGAKSTGGPAPTGAGAPTTPAKASA